jgi:hypothetical protein
MDVCKLFANKVSSFSFNVSRGYWIFANNLSPKLRCLRIAGIETAHMIRKGQLSEEKISAYKQFMALAG